MARVHALLYLFFCRCMIAECVQLYNRSFESFRPGRKFRSPHETRSNLPFRDETKCRWEVLSCGV